ncbi:MAG: glycine zipper 2TM domain-containing protein [Proteobacteria bacterium]|nr:glycine zipper 2TM domain-containing protein [Pseudomonadota bacterium]MBU4298288.1 glycine zipper 2TM domain-containing protein [Pseudomonadota bacterium]MCG2747557.1 glycine zipper domain-containing protein [Desulfobulbaceae bacterium]
MKKLIVLASLVFLCATSNADAGNASSGAVTGAAGGALVGQAVGRNTEGTLIGAAIGAAVGYIVGNEMDNGGYYARQGYSGGNVWVQQPAPVYRQVIMPPPRPVPVVVPYYRPVEVVVIPGPGYKHYGRGYQHGPQWNGGHKAYKNHGRYRR